MTTDLEGPRIRELPIQQTSAVVLARWLYVLRGIAAVGGAIVMAVVLAEFDSVAARFSADVGGDSLRLAFGIDLVTCIGLVVVSALVVLGLRRMARPVRLLAALVELVLLAIVILNIAILGQALIILAALPPVTILWTLFGNAESRKAYRALRGGYRPVSVVELAARAEAKAAAGEQDVIYEVRNLVKHFPVGGNAISGSAAVVQAVSDVTFQIRRGETLGIVGESGCGKTTLGRLLVKLIEPTAGQLIFEGHDLSTVWATEMKRYRAKMQIIFQDPYASLNPRLPIGDIIGEGLYNFGIKRSADRERIVADTLDRVGLRKYYINRYPHEFSGGQRQRIGIARALVLRPSFIVADEPVSALDVSIQSQVLNLLKDLQDEFKLTFVFISHNLQVVEHVSDRVGVMYLGKLVELAPARDVYKGPKHPYSQALLSAVPIPDPTLRRERILLAGDVPSPINPPSGCRFHTRCPIAQEICSQQEPAFEPKGGNPSHLAACHFSDTEQAEELAAKVAV